MPPFPNLISESLLINETIALLRSFGGRASAVKVVDYVMKIRRAEPNLAKLLVSDLIDRDPRIQLNGDMVELTANGQETIDLDTAEFVVFDLETTGAKAPPCRITEIGAFRVKNGKVTGEFHRLVNPEMPIPPFIQGLTGITDAMVRNSPKFRDVMGDFLDFIGDSVLVAHNAKFDMHFLNHEIGKIYEDYRIGNPSICTVHLSRKLLPDIQNHKLKTLAEHFSVALINHHRASDDARATAGVFVNLLEDLQSRGISSLAAAKRFSFRKALC